MALLVVGLKKRFLAFLTNSGNQPKLTRSKSISAGSTATEDLAKQVEESRKSGNIWNAVLNGDLDEVKRLVKKDPKVPYARGPLGEVPLHLCFLYGSEKHIQIARFFIDKYPDTIALMYEKDEYRGENVLHIAIVGKKVELIKFLVEKQPALLHQRAVGTFFQPGQPCYFGEFPLLFAACTNQKSVVEYLVEQGADLNAVDSSGNNILHFCVIHDLKEMYAFVLNLWRKRHPEYHGTPLDKVRNHEHLTPFTLAASMNKREMLSFLLESQKVVQWVYGHVSCELYPLEELDTLPDPRDPHAKGALQIIVEKANLDLLSMPRVTYLLATKWERCAEKPFFRHFVMTLIFISLFSITTVLRQDKNACAEGVVVPEGEEPPVCYHWLVNFFRFLCEIFVFVGVLYKGGREFREMLNVGFRNYFSGHGSAFLENVISSCFCVFIVMASVLRFVDSPYEDMPIALASLSSWMYMLFFLLGFRLTGPFIVMMYRMLVVDVSRFTCLVLVFFMGFSQAMYVLFEDDGAIAFAVRLKALFLAMLGDFDFDEYQGNRFPVLAITLLVIFVVVVSIMLLNILVAMMGDTYGNITEEADKQWSLERARIMFSLQNEMTYDEMMGPDYRYWTDLNGARYLQVISVDEAHYEAEHDSETVRVRNILGMEVPAEVEERLKAEHESKEQEHKEHGKHKSH
eukprot:TRINITY_DN1605_c0_g1_i4.p1 TRINITY_DN1605_c0_g1~~TRINITY_DN1605_c0_g1_i4.p1  ORF type:complete len:685 (+),score=183.66 TRINITY_DN1605_c0_g1_i4:122-2176(+)